MKKKIALALIIMCCTKELFAQDMIHQDQGVIHLKRTKGDHHTILTDRPPQAVFGELYGRSIIFSANYDRRFSSRLDGLGFTVGVGYAEADEFGLFSIPVTVNYLLGNNGKYFEVGAGATYFNANISGFDETDGSTSSTIIGTLTLGYRSQPVNGGFMFRAGVNPLFFQDNFIPYPYVSFGYNF